MSCWLVEKSEMTACLIFVEFFVDKFVLSLLLEGDDDECDEDVDEEERKHDEVDDVEDGHVHPVTGLRSAVFSSRVYGMFQHPVYTKVTHNNRHDATLMLQTLIYIVYSPL